MWDRGGHRKDHKTCRSASSAGSRDGFLIVLLVLDDHPFPKPCPGLNRATRCGKFTARHRSWPDWISSNAIATPAALNPGPWYRLCSRTVAEADSKALLVLTVRAGCVVPGRGYPTRPEHLAPHTL